MKRYRKLQIQLTYNVLCFTHRMNYRAVTSISYDKAVSPETRHKTIKFPLIVVARRHEPPR